LLIGIRGLIILDEGTLKIKGVIIMQATSDKVKEMWGQRFRIVKNGLDEAEVSSFISTLIQQNNELTNKVEHLSALTKLAESTVVEAEKQAKSIKMQTEEEAKAQAASIIATAEEQAKSEADKIIAESKQRAEEVAQTRVALAERKAEEAIKDAEARAGNVKRVAEEEASRIVAEATGNAKKEALLIAQQSNQLLMRSRKMAEREIAEKFKKVCEELLSGVNDSK
jgi:vacuolar-type H+-ATPase subunit H